MHILVVHSVVQYTNRAIPRKVGTVQGSEYKSINYVENNAVCKTKLLNTKISLPFKHAPRGFVSQVECLWA